jgi:hypothetical protein
MYQQLWGYKVEEKLYLGTREQKRLNTTDLERTACVMDSTQFEHNVVRCGSVVSQAKRRRYVQCCLQTPQRNFIQP